ncbi:968_t:CDS:2, partial [Paraglomus occultum]
QQRRLEYRPTARSMAMNTQIHSATNDTPYHLVFAQRPRSNWSLLRERVSRTKRKFQIIENYENQGFENIGEKIGENNEQTNPQVVHNDSSSEDDINLIEQYETGFFIQDICMYRPFRIFPPSRNRAPYVYRIDTWLRYTLHGEFNERNRNFVTLCLENLRKWNDGETRDRIVEENDGLSEIFEMWPERIRQYDERNQAESAMAIDEDVQPVRETATSSEVNE